MMVKLQNYSHLLVGMIIVTIVFSFNPGLVYAVNIGTASAGQLQARSYGSATASKICGDHLCGKEHTTQNNVDVTATKYTIVKKGMEPKFYTSPNLYKAFYQINTDTGVENLKVTITSDTESKDVIVEKIRAHTSFVLSVFIHAEDTDTISIMATEDMSLSVPKSKTHTTAFSSNIFPVTKITSIGDTAYIIDGITPSGGHDAFSYDGSGHKKISGHILVNLDPVTNTGKITADWTDTSGNNWKFQQTKFVGGNEMYVGETIAGITSTTLDSDPVAINHFEHGTTGAGPTIEPTLFVYLASWGPAEIWKDGISQGTFEAHMMITEGARDEQTGKIVKSDGVTPYSPMTPGDSMVNPDTAQLHLVFHTPPGEKTNNFPPPFEQFTHLMFYNLDTLPTHNISKTMNPVLSGDLTASEDGKPFGGNIVGSYQVLADNTTIKIVVDYNNSPHPGNVLEGWLVDKDTGYKLSIGQFNEDNRLYFYQNMVNPWIYDILGVTEEPVNDINPINTPAIGGVHLVEPFGK